MGEVPSPVPPDRRDLFNESFFEYGSRVGVWRILDLCRAHGVPASWWACARALERNPEVARALVEAGHEICGHGYGWEDFHSASRDEERENIRRTVDSLVRTTGQRPLGWFTRYACSPNTRELLVEEGGFLYDSLGLNDDLPYYVTVKRRPWLVVPYTFEINDARFWRGGLVSVGDFAEYMRSAFDCLYAEAARVPTMMPIGLHCRIAGTPAPSRAHRPARVLSRASWTTSSSVPTAGWPAGLTSPAGGSSVSPRRGRAPPRSSTHAASARRGRGRAAARGAAAASSRARTPSGGARGGS